MTPLSDGQLLLLLLWLFYFSDCFIRLDKATVLFSTAWGHKWIVRTANPHLGSASGGWSLLNPFPPFGQFIVTHLLPLSLSPEHIASFNSRTLAQTGRAAQPGRILSWPEVSEIRTHETELWIRDELFCKLPTPEAARILAGLLDELKTLPSDQRASRIEKFWNHRLDSDTALSEIQVIGSALSVLRFACTVLFALLYVALPLAAMVYGANGLVIPGAIALFLMALTIAVEYYRVHRRLFPSYRSDRMTHGIQMILCPPMAIRAPDRIQAKALTQFDDLSLATHLLKDEAKRRFLTRTIRDLRHPVDLNTQPEPLRAVCAWQNATILRLAAQRLPGFAEACTDSRMAPARETGTLQSYCPRCLVQLTLREGTCPDCSGVPLSPFDPPPKDPKESGT